jgi:low temperature requirement protein LtrA
VPIVAGMVVSAVADELVLAHPTGHTELKVAAAVLGGPALFLIGNLLFKGAIAGRLPLSHLVGLGLLALLMPTATLLSPLALAAAATAILITVATWETLSLKATRANLSAT